MIESVLSADQVIFTSIPSFMGEGYRIVAATGSVGPKERMEITQRCPSHNALSNPSPDATAILSFPLTTGRFCIGYSCYAGTEHTARGGRRVYTRLAILDKETFRKFDFNPLPIHAILAGVVGPTPSLNIPNRLDPLILSPQACSSPLIRMSSSAQTIGTFIKLVLESRQIVAAGYPDPETILNWTITLVTFEFRAKLSVSIGLNYVPARKLQLTFLDHDDGQTKRLVRGRNIDWLEPAATMTNLTSAFDPWITFIENSLNAGQYNQLQKLNTLLDIDPCPENLKNLADQCIKLDSSDETGSANKPATIIC
ncbi:MAG: hypothetical protein GX629_05040 [Phycisphaerae bacterium]|jgi:hypothetical protein|nr:hypothetical protein [Phycisphaerae bacterium]